MIGTDQLRNDRRAGVQDAGATMTTDVSDHADLVLVVTQKNDADLADIDHNGIACFGHFAFEADIDPVPHEEDVEIGFENIIARVETRGQRMAVSTRVEKRGNGGGEPVEHNTPLSEDMPIMAERKGPSTAQIAQLDIT